MTSASPSISLSPRPPVRNPALGIRVWLVDDLRIRKGRTGGAEQCEVGTHIGCPKADRGIILDLTGHKNAWLISRGQADAFGSDIVFRDTGRDDCLAQVTRTGQRRRLHPACLGNQSFKSAFPCWIEIDPQIVEDQRSGWHQVRAKTDRPQEPVFHPLKRNTLRLGPRSQRVRHLASPDHEAPPLRTRKIERTIRLGLEPGRTSRALQKGRDGPMLPRLHARADHGFRVLPPRTRLSGHQLRNRLEPTQTIAKRVIPCRIVQHGARKELLNAQPARPGAHEAPILCQPPTGIEWLRESHRFLARQHRLEAKAANSRNRPRAPGRAAPRD